MNSTDVAFKCFRVSEKADGDSSRFIGERSERKLSELPPGDVLIKVHYSSLNYKDALSANGNKSVTRQYPHTPGIDAAGTVVNSDIAQFKCGDQVLVTGYDLGMNTDGGFSEYIRVPATWVLPLPVGLTLHHSMVLGTAGFTAALCVEKLIQTGLSPDKGEILVTGATGGVGVIAVALLAKLGYTVTACTGKHNQESFLKDIGATSIIDRAGLAEPSTRPLLKERWAGAVDVAGGELLWNILKSLQYGGSVACCGLVGAPTLNATVFPFILRGVNLLGVDSVNLPLEKKGAIWALLASSWALPKLETIGTDITLWELAESLQTILAGRAVGRMILNLSRPN
ncbi:MAG: YhdH/YhfP family quinone oxidoreductase [Gammaproteobacteria bacterium]|nr:YhdH/YhfP family quinone oxidoreductase [Gammaproteobacteria bacterium]MDP2349222.1 YhdH/YhfP family quinone oxidoreductase [Gammaproteobacteria bacterium]